MKINFFEELDKYSFLKAKKSKKLNFKVLSTDNFLLQKSRNITLTNNVKKTNLLIFIASLVIVLFLFLYRAFYLQVIKGEHYVTLANQNRIRTLPIIPERGVIYDKNGVVLARNKPSFSLLIDTNYCTGNKCDALVNSISDDLIKDKTKILQKLNEPNPYKTDFLVIASNLTKQDYLDLTQTLIKNPVLQVISHSQREYLYGAALAHVLGYTGLADTLEPKIVGKTGVEQVYDPLLQGVFGSEIIEVDSFGKPISTISKTSALPGKDIYLNIDINLQLIAYQQLKQKIDKGEAKSGSVVMQNPKNGGVMVLANYPSFDPNKFITGITQKELQELNSDLRFPFFNRAISGAYPPASTFKMIPAAAALQEGTINKNTSIVDNGYLQIGVYIFRNWKLSGHGVVDVVRALQVSNDTFFYTVGGGYGQIKGLGIKKLYDWAVKFGFGQALNIDLPGESGGFMPDGTYKDWYLGDTYITTIGQGDVLATPLQVNSMVNYFASNQKLFEPKLLLKVEGDEEIVPQVISQNLLNDQTYSTVVKGMEAAVRPGGTAYPLFDFYTRHAILLAGKTGTAEFGPVDNTKTHAWFSVYGPVSNPNFTVTVFLEEGGSGSSDASPIAKELLVPLLLPPK